MRCFVWSLLFAPRSLLLAPCCNLRDPSFQVILRTASFALLRINHRTFHRHVSSFSADGDPNILEWMANLDARYVRFAGPAQIGAVRRACIAASCLMAD